MNTPRDDHDAKIAELLDAARAEVRSQESVETTINRASELELTEDVAKLLPIVARLEAAVGNWRAGTQPPQQTAKAEPAFKPSDTLGRYIVQAEINSGGMGTVYKALDPQLNRTVAIKVPRLEGDSSELRQRFLREARAAAVVRHPNICPIYDVGEQAGTPYAVMACIEGETLAELISAGPLEVGRALTLFHKIAQGLEAVHAQKITHRDLKPRNILLDAQGEPYLTDFGLSRPEGDGDKLTREGMLVGTPAYMAPEQVEGNSRLIGSGTDIYSLGVLLYQMLTGRLPFEGPTHTILHKITHDTPLPPSKVRPGLDSRLDEVIATAMARHRSRRYGTVAEFAAAVARLENPDEKTVALPVSRSPSRRHVLVSTALALGVLAILLASILLILRTPEGDLIVQVSEPGAQVRVFHEGGKIEVRRADKSVINIRVDPGKHRLEVEKDGFQLFTEAFSIEKRGTKTIEARLMPIPVTPIPVATPGRDRQAAEWVLSLGGRVQIWDDKGKRTLAKLPLPAHAFSVTQVFFPSGAKFADADLTHLEGLSGLVYIDFTETSVSDAGLYYLRGSPELREIIATRTQITGSGFKHLEGHPNLHSLWMGACPIVDDSLTSVATLKNIRLLQFQGSNVTDAGLKHLRGVLSLKELNLQARPITDAGIGELANFRDLEMLALHRSRVTDAGLAIIKNFTKLKRLYLADSLITDAGLAHIKGLRDLERLGVERTKITDDGLAQLHGLTKLEILYIGGANTTPEGIAKLRKALPKCSIE